MNIEHLYKIIIVTILYSDSWILSRTHSGRSKCLWPGPKDQVFSNSCQPPSNPCITLQPFIYSPTTSDNTRFPSVLSPSVSSSRDN
jgi:hypothetical protein